jgi:hypothetical protein
VANNGTDSTDCGPRDKPACRSVSRAIANATDGDKVIVGPGLYGDVNGDGAVDPNGYSGEEAPVTVTVGTNSHPAIININKQLTIVSRDGAGATVIEAGGADSIGVYAAAAGVVFGKTGKGFTVRNAQYGGVYISADGVIVQGNIAENCDYFGFLAGYYGAVVNGSKLKRNVANSTSYGFAVFDRTAVVSGNLAKGDGAGFLVLGSSSTVVAKNVAVSNGYGFWLYLHPPDSGTTLPTFSKNAAIGNSKVGVLINVDGAVGAVTATMAENTLYGNGEWIDNPSNCGLAIGNSEDGGEPLTIDANGNYWGAASGPGANPADAAGGASCSGGTAPVVLNLTEWASEEIKVKPPVVK